MARGRSGRVVVEVDPALKKELYVALAQDESSLKDWFVDQARSYILETTRLRRKRKVGQP